MIDSIMIRIKKSTKKLMDKNKKYPEQTYDGLILALLRELNYEY